MFTSMLKTKLIAVSVALGMIFSNSPIFHKPMCFIPSPAAESSLQGESFGTLIVVETDDVEFSCRFIEWLRDIF